MWQNTETPKPTKIINTMKGRPSFFDMEGQRI
jgi:hypothetical protein